jgi:hypothetical protein
MAGRSVLGLLRFSTKIKNVFESPLGGWNIIGYDHLRIFKKTNFVKIVFEHGLIFSPSTGTHGPWRKLGKNPYMAEQLEGSGC